MSDWTGETTMTRRHHGICLSAALASLTVLTLPETTASADTDVTTVRITDRVLVENTSRFGINLGGDAYYSGAALRKKRDFANFEGTTYRQCHFGPVQDEHGATTWFTLDTPWARSWMDLLAKEGRYTILSGPAKWTTGRIKAISTRKVEHQGKMKDFMYFGFDRAVEAGPANGGLMLEAHRLRDGQFRPLDGYWTSKNNEIAIGDVPPGSFGCAALNLKGSDGKAHLRFSTHYQRYGETNGTWQVHFWAKAKDGTPTLKIAADREYGESRDLKPSGEWTKYEETLIVDKVPEPKGPKDNPHLLFLFEARGGDVLIDDVEIWMDGDTNPTAFRDDVVEMLRRYNPGPIRYLQMGGSTLDNTIAPPLRSHSFTSRRGDRVGPYQRHGRHPYSLHQLYELCEHLGAEPWYTLPGTLSKDEMAKLMEYLAAPADMGYGKKRAEMGHPTPWTEVFERIHVEFGNEAWNNAGPYQCGGFNGPGYWHDLIEVGKTSPHYRPNVLFHAAGQASYASRNQGIMENVPNADRFAVAPYILHSLTQRDLELNPDDSALFKWVFTWPIWRSRDKRGAMLQNCEHAQKANVELSIYEVNHHTTHGDAPLKPRNKIVTSIAGGLNVVNNMLLMMKEHHLRTQCLFALAQHGYRAKSGVVRLWGTALCMRKGHERYRPTFLACATANRVIAGDLIETSHAGADPTFDVTGIFYKAWRKPAVPETLRDVPAIWSYAFADGNKRGLILINLDTSKQQNVAVEFAGEVEGNVAKSWLLTADKITANNEYEVGEPQVRAAEEKVADFASESQVTLPPFSVRTLAWTVLNDVR